MSVASAPLAVLIGRFQPPHRLHLALMRQALARAPRLVVVLGSARHAPTPKNPLTDDERARLMTDMLRAAGEDTSRVRFAPVPDFFYNLALWQAAVRQAVGSPEALLCGFEKDASSFYLRLFPEWQAAPPDLSGLSSAARQLSATRVRAELYARRWHALNAALTPEVLAGLRRWAHGPTFEEVLADQQATMRLAGHGPIRDEAALVVSGDRLLLCRRRARPGLGLWSLPSAVPQATGLRFVRARCLDHPDRLPGLDWQTTARLWRASEPFPAPPGSRWASLSLPSERPETFFADHAQGIRALLEGWPAAQSGCHQ